MHSGGMKPLTVMPIALLASACGTMLPSDSVLQSTPAGATPAATNAFPTAAQIEAQRLNPDMRFERPGQGKSWIATPTGWGWSPVLQDRP